MVVVETLARGSVWWWQTEHRCPDCHSSAGIPQLMFWHCFRHRWGRDALGPYHGLQCLSEVSRDCFCSLGWCCWTSSACIWAKHPLFIDTRAEPSALWSEMPSFGCGGAHNVWLGGNAVYLARILKLGNSNAICKPPALFHGALHPRIDEAPGYL